MDKMKIGEKVSISEIPQRIERRNISSKYDAIFDAAKTLNFGESLPIEFDSREEMNRFANGVSKRLRDRGIKVHRRRNAAYLYRKES